MADASTTRYLLTKPEVGASADTWGTKLNTDWDSVDKLLGAITTAGSGAAYTLTSGQSLSAYTAGQGFWIKASFTCSGAATLNVDSLGAKNITKNGTTATVSGDIVSGTIYYVSYDGTQFQIVGPISGGLQPLDATLTALAALSWSSGTPLVQFTAADTVSLTLTPTPTSVQAGVGSASAPSFSFSTDTNTGVYWDSADVVALGAGGTRAMHAGTFGVVIDSGPVYGQDGTVSAPGHTFINDQDCGLYRIGANNIGIALSGTKYGDLAPTLFDFTAPTRAKMPVSSETTGTLTSASARKKVNATGGITLDGNVFAADDFMLIYAGASSRTLTQGATGSPTQRLHGSATTGNLTIAAYGFAIVHWVSATEWSVMGDVS